MAVEKIIEQPQLEKIETMPLSPEKIASPETKAEQVQVAPEKKKEAVKPSEKTGQASPAIVSAIPDWQQKQMAAIDSILADGLNDVFLKMNPGQQQAFKTKGEETVEKINKLLNQTKVKVNKIIELIKAWLKFIPGVNRFFLEQEAKIKADRIIKIKDRF